MLPLFLLLACLIPKGVGGEKEVDSTMEPNPPLSGFNIPDLMWRAITTSGRVDPKGLSSATATISSLCSSPDRSFTALRFPLLPFYPDALGPVVRNSSQYFVALDTVFEALARAGCTQVVPVLFPNPFALLDVFNEDMVVLQLAVQNRSGWGRGQSQGWDASLAFIDALTARYASQPIIKAWELTSAWNYAWDVDQTLGCTACSALNATPATRGRNFNVSTEVGVGILNQWAGRVREGDGPYPRPVSAGHALPRPSATHLLASFGSGVEDWREDSYGEFSATFAKQHAGMDWLSVHLYPGPGMVRSGWGGGVAGGGLIDAATIAASGDGGIQAMLLQLTALAANLSLPSIASPNTVNTASAAVITTTSSSTTTTTLSAGLSIPLFIGEYGAPPTSNPSTASISPSALNFTLPRPYITRTLSTLVATAGGEDPLAMAPPPAPGVRGMVTLAFLSNFESGGGAMDGIWGGMGAWAGGKDGILAALGALRAGNASGLALWRGQSDGVLGEVFGYNALHREPPLTPPGSCSPPLYLPSFTYQTLALHASAQACFARILSLTNTEFRPPPAFDVATVMCKGPCRVYMAAWFRLREAGVHSRCECGGGGVGWMRGGGAPAPTVDPAIANATGGGFMCPHSAQAELCRRLGLCYDEDVYHNYTCAPEACGRWAGSSALYNPARTACRVNWDGVGGGGGGVAALALAFTLAVSAWVARG